MWLWQTTRTSSVSPLLISGERTDWLSARPLLPSQTVNLWPHTGYFTANLRAKTVFMSTNLCTSTPHASLIYTSRRHRPVNILMDCEAKKGYGVSISNGKHSPQPPRQPKRVWKSHSHLFCIRSSENICSFPEVFGALCNRERAVQESPWVNITARCTGRFFLFPRRISCHCFFLKMCVACGL